MARRSDKGPDEKKRREWPANPPKPIRVEITVFDAHDSAHTGGISERGERFAESIMRQVTMTDHPRDADGVPDPKFWMKPWLIAGDFRLAHVRQVAFMMRGVLNSRKSREAKHFPEESVRSRQVTLSFEDAYDCFVPEHPGQKEELAEQILQARDAIRARRDQWTLSHWDNVWWKFTDRLRAQLERELQAIAFDVATFAHENLTAKGRRRRYTNEEGTFAATLISSTYRGFPFSAAAHGDRALPYDGVGHVYVMTYDGESHEAQIESSRPFPRLRHV